MLKVAVVGCGRMGECHVGRLVNDARSEVVALFDVNEQQAVRLQNELAPEATVYNDWDALLNDATVEAVVICTPTAHHYQQILDCRKRGWNVLCEKPLANTRQEISALCQQSREGGPVLSVGYQRRHWSLTRWLKKELDSGKWGAVKAITSVNCEQWQQTIAGTWRDDPKVNPGGYVGDAGSHKIDAIFHLTGLVPHRLFAQTSLAGSQVEILATVAAQLVDPQHRFDSDPPTVPLSMQFVGNSQSFVENLYIHCEKADFYVRERQLWMARDGEVEEIQIDQSEMWIDSVTNPITGFLDQIVDGKDGIAPPECALPVFDITQAIRMSAQLHQEIVLDQQV